MVLYVIGLFIIGIVILIFNAVFDINKNLNIKRGKKVHWRDDDGVSNLESITYIPSRKAHKNIMNDYEDLCIDNADVIHRINKYEDLPPTTYNLNNLDIPDLNKLANIPESRIQERTMYIEAPAYELADYKPRKFFDEK